MMNNGALVLIDGTETNKKHTIRSRYTMLLRMVFFVDKMEDFAGKTVAKCSFNHGKWLFLLQIFG